MAKTDNLTDFMLDLAEGIRAKKGTTEPINPQDFRKEIESISGGGSGGGESSIEYLDVSGMNDDNKSSLIMHALLLKLTGEDVILGTQIISNGVYSRTPIPSKVTALSIDVTMPLTKYMSPDQSDKQELTTLEEMGISVFTDNLPRLTKEQFYSLD